MWLERIKSRKRPVLVWLISFVAGFGAMNSLIASTRGAFGVHYGSPRKPWGLGFSRAEFLLYLIPAGIGLVAAVRLWLLHNSAPHWWLAAYIAEEIFFAYSLVTKLTYRLFLHPPRIFAVLSGEVISIAVLVYIYRLRKKGRLREALPNTALHPTSSAGR